MRSIELTRRRAVASALGTGFALAVRPISAQTIHTEGSDLVTGEIQIPVSDGSLPGYRAQPKGGKTFPVVLVVQEIFGVHEHIKDVCRRLAKVGYLAVAPELYHRQGDVSKMSDMREILSKVVSKVPDAQVLSDLDATAVWAAKSGGDGARLGITGFCWGGRIVWLYTAHNRAVKAGVAWYGRLTGDKTPLQPRFPLDIVGELHAPVLGLYGGKDQGIPLDTVEAMQKALAAAHQPSEIHVYPEAGHAFNADYRPSYVKSAAEDGWKRMLGWFKKFGV